MAIDAIDTKLIDTLLAGFKKPEDIIGKNGFLKQLTKALLERAMNAELTEHVAMKSTIRRGTTAATHATAQARKN